MKKNVLILKVMMLFLTLILIETFFYSVNASSKPGDAILANIEKDIDNWKAAGLNGVNMNTAEITESFLGIGQVMTTLGIGVLVIVTIYMGIKYLTSGPEVQAKLKTQLIGLVVAGVVISASYVIWKFVILFAARL